MRTIMVALVCALGPTCSAWADTVIERYSRSDGFAGMGGFEMASVETTSATAQRDESRMKFTGGFMSAIQKMAGLGDHVRITRLDRDLVWMLDSEKKTYTEAPLTARGERDRPTPGQRPAGGKEEPSDWVVTRNELTVEKTGARKVINAFPCDEYLMTWTVETRNQKTGETGKSVMTDHLWTTPETAETRAAHAEVLAYQQAYLKKIGMEMSPAEAKRFLAGLTGVSEAEQQKALTRLSGEMAKVQGFTIVSQLEWTAEGGPAAERKGTARGGAPGDLGQSLGKLFGGGKPSGTAESTPGRGGGEGSPSLFNFYTEIKSLRAGGHDAARFEVPAGYRLAK